MISSPLDRWIDATLRVLAMLVQNVAATLQMTRRRKPVIGTQAMPSALPRETHDTRKEQSAVQQDSPLHSAHGEQRSKAARPSNHERVLTTASHKLPQHEHSHSIAPPSLRSSRRTPGPRASRVLCVTGLLTQPWIPAFAGMSGENLTARNKNAPV